ncbi:THAP domain-containing protein 6-like isoform X2 [Synchiropus splendidus]|uniref:THAP domain-containing protein 6-like isoform X2 n=1 Tax=Synchiropus splendidus TaxID=270530 RepID=UPI00237E1AD0|nr:THAP domain-containing protein 6-like isoform X2 [Synchiropus splendidus]
MPEGKIDWRLTTTEARDLAGPGAAGRRQADDEGGRFTTQRRDVFSGPPSWYRDSSQQITDTTGERCLTPVLLLDAPVSETPKPNPVESLFTDMTLRTQWERAVKRSGFVASAVLCSEHFKADDFDRTGQTVRLRHGVTPSVFSFASHLQKQVQPRTTRNSRKIEESPAVDQPKAIREAKPQSNVMPIPEAATVGLMDKIKNAKLNAALARVESLEHARRNCMIRERRAKKNLDALLEELRETSLINAELRQRLEGDSGPCLSLSPELSP